MIGLRDAYICDFARTPIGRYGGALSKVRADDLAAIPLKALIALCDMPVLLARLESTVN